MIPSPPCFLHTQQIHNRVMRPSMHIKMKHDTFARFYFKDGDDIYHHSLLEYIEYIIRKPSWKHMGELIGKRLTLLCFKQHVIDSI